MSIWTCERIAHWIGCSVEQVHRWCVLGKLPSYKTSTDGKSSKYGYRINEHDLLEFFNCETVEDFKKVQYR